MPILPGRRLGPHEILSAIGAGGMGRMRPAALDEPGTVAASIQSADAFFAMARTASASVSETSKTV
jgi:hypothetical protein